MTQGDYPEWPDDRKPSWWPTVVGVLVLAAVVGLGVYWLTR